MLSGVGRDRAVGAPVTQIRCCHYRFSGLAVAVHEAAVPAVPAIMPALVSVVSLPGAMTTLLPLGSYPNC